MTTIVVDTRRLSRRGMIAAGATVVACAAIGLPRGAAAIPWEEPRDSEKLLAFRHAHISDYIIGL
jgi:hypothetical protein